MKYGLTILMTAMLLTGCDNHLKDVVKSGLKDPESAQFQGKIEADRWACIEVNSKNSYGGYTGYKATYLRNNTTMGWQVMDMGEGERCHKSTVDGFAKYDKDILSFEPRMIELMRGHKLIPKSAKKYADIPAGDCQMKLVELQVLADFSLDRVTAAERSDYLRQLKQSISDVESGSCQKRL